MKFDDFWGALVGGLKEPRTLTSLSQTGEYQAKYSGGLVHITTGNSIWTISRSEVQGVWNKSLGMEPQVRFKTFSYGHDHGRTLPYILALIRDFAGQDKME